MADSGRAQIPEGGRFAAASFLASASTLGLMQVGEIGVEGVARRFRVHTRDARTLKDLFVQRGKTDAIDVWALRDVSAHVGRGEAVGLIGRNGSGKTTLLRLIAGIIKPTAGRIRTEGRIGSLLELGAGFHMDFNGRENVFLNGAIQGLPRAEIKRRFDEIVAFAELENAIDRPVRTYSSGMTMRLGFAIAAFLDADILLLDEVFAVGDEAFQRKCFGRIFAFKERGGTIVFVSHDASAVERLCERSVFLEGGQVAFDGPTREAVTRYRRALADDANPAERGVGLREWGSGEASIASAALVGHEGPTACSSSPASRSSSRWRSRPTGSRRRGCSSSSATTRGRSWRVTRSICAASAGPQGTAIATFASTSVHFRSRTAASIFASASRTRPGEHVYHWLDDALVFVVYPGDDMRGVVRFEGTWMLEEKTATG